MKTSIATVFCVCLILAPNRLLAAILVGAPSGAEGNTFAQEPFSLSSFGLWSSRYQQVYDASLFASELPNGGLITALAFRADATVGRSFSATLPEVQIDFAISSRSPDELSATFEDNIAGSLAMVHPRGSFHFGSPGPGSGNFINLTTPYFYNPANGNLLLQIRNFQNIISEPDPFFLPSSLDAHNDPADTVARVFAADGNATVGTVDSIGLTTFFLVEPIPEPSTVALSILGVISLCCLRWKRKRNN